MTGVANDRPPATGLRRPVPADCFGRIDGRGPASVVELLALDVQVTAL